MSEFTARARRASSRLGDFGAKGICLRAQITAFVFILHQRLAVKAVIIALWAYKSACVRT